LSHIARPLTNLLAKDVPFNFDDVCLKAFETLKKALISTPIIHPPNWSLPFEIMCDTSDYIVGAVLGQSKDKKHRAIAYASKTLSEPQLNYATIEKELLAIVSISYATPTRLSSVTRCKKCGGTYNHGTYKI
jgi:hypothetical protein